MQKVSLWLTRLYRILKLADSVGLILRVLTRKPWEVTDIFQTLLVVMVSKCLLLEY
jgi:hypothetical protein